MRPSDVEQTPSTSPGSSPARLLTLLIGGLALVVLAVILVTGSYRFLTAPGTGALAQGPAKPVNVPQLLREGDRIIVPEGSPLRDKLKVETVEEQEV